jgi:hypothetical protein
MELATAIADAASTATMNVAYRKGDVFVVAGFYITWPKDSRSIVWQFSVERILHELFTRCIFFCVLAPYLVARGDASTRLQTGCIHGLSQAASS